MPWVAHTSDQRAPHETFPLITLAHEKRWHVSPVETGNYMNRGTACLLGSGGLLCTSLADTRADNSRCDHFDLLIAQRMPPCRAFELGSDCDRWAAPFRPLSSLFYGFCKAQKSSQISDVEQPRSRSGARGLNMPVHRQGKTKINRSRKLEQGVLGGKSREMGTQSHGTVGGPLS